MKFKTSFFTACLVCTKARRTPFPVREYSGSIIKGLYNKSWVSKRAYILKQTQKLPTKKSGVKLNLY